jgi:hypothetical protein
VGALEAGVGPLSVMVGAVAGVLAGALADREDREDRDERPDPADAT